MKIATYITQHSLSSTITIFTATLEVCVDEESGCEWTAVVVSVFPSVQACRCGTLG